MSETFLNGKVTLLRGDCRARIKELDDCSVDAVVTDPPYSLVSIIKRFGKDGAAPAKSNGATGVYRRASAGFMGARWDVGDVAFDPEFWVEVLRVMKPGAHLAAMGGDRTFHRLACAIEDAGAEIRHTIAWVYASGFPKSLNVSKAIDKMAGADRKVIRERYTARRIKPGATVVREGAYGKQDVTFTACDTAPATDEAAQWEGWGSALKPAMELICLARKPLSESSIAANVLKHGTGAINIDGCRVGTTGARNNGRKVDSDIYGKLGPFEKVEYDKGRWPANLIHDGSEEVVERFPETESNGCDRVRATGNCYGEHKATPFEGYIDSGSAARFFYTAKADAMDRLGSKHPTVKPLDLMQYLVRLVTPKGGMVLDPFAGTGTTLEAAWREGMRAVGIEREEEYQADIVRRMGLCLAGPEERVRESIKARGLVADAGPLFGGQPC